VKITVGASPSDLHNVIYNYKTDKIVGEIKVKSQKLTPKKNLKVAVSLLRSFGVKRVELTGAPNNFKTASIHKRWMEYLCEWTLTGLEINGPSKNRGPPPDLQKENPHSSSVCDLETVDTQVLFQFNPHGNRSGWY